jgi:hypothetical protein
VERHSRHRDRLARRLAARRERDIEQPRGALGVVVEQLVEIAHAIEQQHVGVLRLQAQVLLHHGCMLVRLVGRGRGAWDLLHGSGIMRRRKRIGATRCSLTLRLALACASMCAAGQAPARDLQGLWEHRNMTPLERPDDLATLVITRAEATRLEQQVTGFFYDPTKPSDPLEFLDVRRLEQIDGQFRSSMIVDPESGKVPWKEAYRREARRIEDTSLVALDGPEQRPLDERCLAGAGGPPITTYPVSNIHQIIEAPGVVVIASESMHDVRVVRLDARHAHPQIVSWSGDSIGWWQGDTLIVETRNFAPTSRARSFPFATYFVSPATTLVERFTRTSSDKLRYVFTISDPEFYTRSWTGETLLVRTASRTFEDACHEGNYSLRFILQGARVQELDASRAQH